jgi:hypothetical protein
MQRERRQSIPMHCPHTVISHHDVDGRRVATLLQQVLTAVFCTADDASQGAQWAVELGLSEQCYFSFWVVERGQVRTVCRQPLLWPILGHIQ